jgi:hypothetical protein
LSPRKNTKSFSIIWGVHGIYKEIAPYYAGSTKPKPFSGWPYDTVLKILVDKPDLQTRDFSTQVLLFSISIILGFLVIL